MDVQFWIDNAGSLFHQLFLVVMAGLYGLAHLFDTTYEIINIIVYFVIIPASWVYLVSRKTSKWINLISAAAIVWFISLPIEETCNYTFQKSVDFVNWTAEVFGSNYIDMCVYLCIAFPVLVYLILIPITLPKRIKKIIMITIAVIFGLYMILIYPNFKDLLLKGLDIMNIKY